MKSHNLAELAKLLNAELKGDADCVVNNLNVIQNAQAGDITFIINSRYKKYLADTKASAVILSSNFAEHCNTNVLIVDNPHLAYAKVASLFQRPFSPQIGVHSSAVIGNDCKIAATASIGANCTIGNNVHINNNVIIHAGTVIGDCAVIGKDTLLHANVTVYPQVRIGERTIIHSGVIIGSDGFSFAHDNDRWFKVAQIGSVIIGNDVEIGANTTIDCGAIENTVIDDGVKLDNQIQIGHNVRIGANTLIAGCVGIAGSTVIGKNCIIGGASGIAGHLTITDNVIVTGKSQVNHSLNQAGIYSSAIKAQPIEKWRKNVARLANLDEMAKRIKKMETVLNQMGKKHD